MTHVAASVSRCYRPALARGLLVSVAVVFICIFFKWLICEPAAAQ